MEMAYEGVSPQRKFKVLVNPMGGKGQAKKIYETRVKPILDAARSIYDTQHTTHRFHAEEIAAALPLDTNPIDAILALSGDGLPHEIINGLASRKDAKLALRTPVVPVPTGSANGFNINLQGVKHTFDVGLAVLNAIKGKPLELDLLSVVQNGKRRWSFYSQAFGLMADIDLGTENIRWMGDTRFVMGYIRGIFNRKPSPIDLFVKVAKSDKEELVKDLIEHSSASGKPASQALPTETNTPGADVPEDTSLPQDQFINEDTTSGDWIQFDKPMIYVYGGMMPYVAADLMQFPMATPAQGVVDLVVQEMVSRGTMVSAMDGAEHGKQFWMPSQVYYKAKAFKVTPKAGSKGFISIDGEAFPWGEIYVEVHKGLMHTLTLNGDRFVSTFDPHGGPQGKNKGKTVAK
ncbi:hypothetical protein DL93DRAFT_2178850 [Clavulina sp. PMI_390]|nr:hypothetical protein DL93DRAFT_2178850 [Clavulina sp. PMI_390]